MMPPQQLIPYGQPAINVGMPGPVVPHGYFPPRAQGPPYNNGFAQGNVSPHFVQQPQYANGHINGQVNGHVNGHINGHTNGQVNGHTNGNVNGNQNGNGTRGGNQNGQAQGAPAKPRVSREFEGDVDMAALGGFFANLKHK